MADDRRSRRERFARAVAAPTGPGGTARVPPLDDPDLAAELAVVATLRRHASDALPTRDERERMRRTVLAAAADPGGPPARTGAAVLSLPRARGGVRRRFGVAVAAMLVLLAALSGLSVLLSQGALPGDPLYRVKRTVEAASLGFTFGEQARGMQHLKFAADRVDEIRELTDRARHGAAPPVAAFRTALHGFDADALAGSRALTTAGTSADASALDSLQHWARHEYQQLDSLAGRMPAAAVRGTRLSVTLLSRMIARVGALRQRLGCEAITSGASDELGPLPATGRCAVPEPVVPDATTGPLPGSRRGAVAPLGPVITGARPDGPRTSAASPPASTTAPPQPASPTPGGSVTLPPSPTGGLLPGDQAPDGTQPGTSASSPPTLLVPLPFHLGTLDPILGLPGVRFG